MRQLAFENAWWLLVVLLAIPMGVLALAGFRSMARLRRGSAAIFRLALFMLCALALAGASTIRETDRVAVVIAADVSGSVLRFGATSEAIDGSPALAMRQFIETASASRGTDDLLGVLAFAGEVMPVSTPTAGPIADRPFPPLAEDGTDIASALSAAATMIPPDASGRIVLISDGNATTGDALEVAQRLSRAQALGEGVRGGLPIDVVPIDYRVEREVMVEFVDTPPRAAQGSIAPVRVGLRSTSPAAGTLRLLLNGRDLGLERRVLLDAGRRVEVFEVPLPEGRIHRFEAVFEPEERDGVLADTSLANNSGQAFAITPGDGAVLLVGRDGADATLARTLTGMDMAVERIPPLGVPTDLVTLESYDLIVLMGVGADEVPIDAQQSLARFVTEMGGGLIMVGGERSFGAGGWRGSPIEPILPLHLDLPQQAQTPEVAIALVLDNSGSMRRGVLGSARSQQEIANEAAALAVLNMPPGDQVCVITFNSTANLLVPITPNNDPKRTARAIRGISSGGGTRIGPAMLMAAEQVGSVPAKSRHIIVLTDGLAMDADELQGLAAQINSRNITISTIAVGDGADTETMKKVADAAGGTFYNVVNPNVLPQIFLGEVSLTRTPLVRTGVIVPVVMPTPSPATAGLGAPPPLSGLNLTRVRQEPTVTLAMTTREGEPLLAHWNAGVGRVATFTSDAGQWADAWIGWPGYEQFWGQLVRAMARTNEDPGIAMRLEQNAGNIRIELEAFDESGQPFDSLTAEATLYDPSGLGQAITLAQVSPGIYEGMARGSSTGAYVVIVRPMQSGRALPPMLAGLTISGGQEFRSLASDTEALHAIARATGGRVLSLSDANLLFDRSDTAPSQARQALWRLLLGWALAVLVLDIGTRRVAWDRLVSSAFGADWLRATATLGRQGRGAAEAIDTLRASGGTRATERIRRTRGDADVSATDTDAQRSAYEAQQRILRSRVERAAASQMSIDAGDPSAITSGQSSPKNSDKAEQSESGLMAAKRRARARYEDEIGS